MSIFLFSLTTSHFSFTSVERIKSIKLFERLFTEGKVIKSFPIKLIWIETEYASKYPLKVAVNVSKRNMPHAVDRNRMKRLMREAYRLNKSAIHELLCRQEKSLALLFIASCKTPLSYKQTQEKIILLLHRLIKLHEQDVS